jgi:hypothetical protein
MKILSLSLTENHFTFTILQVQIDQSKGCNGFFRQTEIPKWFIHQNREGSSVPIPLPHDLYENSRWRGIALCTVFDVFDKNLNNENSPNQDSKSFHEFICRLDVDGGVVDSPMVYNFPKGKFYPGSFGLWIYITHAMFRGQIDVRSCISPSVTTNSPDVKIKLFGARILYEDDMAEFVQNFTQEALGSPDVLRQRHQEFIEYHSYSSESPDDQSDSKPNLKRELNSLLSILYQVSPYFFTQQFSSFAYIYMLSISAQEIVISLTEQYIFMYFTGRPCTKPLVRLYISSNFDSQMVQYSKFCVRHKNAAASKFA